jgi:hypothetical protein
LRVFKATTFARVAAKASIADRVLFRAAREVQGGIVEANLGGGVFKKRVAREGAGKSGGYRCIVVFDFGERLFFVDMFAKSDRDNISASDAKLFKQLAAELLNCDDAAVEKLLSSGAYVEILEEDIDAENDENQEAADG